MNRFDKIVGSILTEQELGPDIFDDNPNWEVTSKIKGADLGFSGNTNLPRADSREFPPAKPDWDTIDYVWNWLGMVPIYGAGTIFDLTHAISYFIQGHWIIAILTALCAIPGAGDVLGLVKIMKGGKAAIRKAALSGAIDRGIIELLNKKGTVMNLLERGFSKTPAMKQFFEKNIKGRLDPVFNKLAQYASKPVQSRMGQAAAILAVDVPTSLAVGHGASSIMNAISNMPRGDTTNNAAPWVEPKPYSH